MKRALMIPMLTLGALALAGCANDKPATDASDQTTTTSARSPDGLMSANPNDTNATGAATNMSPKNQPGVDADGHAIPNTNGSASNDSSSNMTGQGMAGSNGFGDTRASAGNGTGKTGGATRSGSGAGTASTTQTTPQPGNNGNAAGAGQPGVTAPPPPAGNNGGAALTPIDQGNNPTDLKITQQIRKAVVGDSSLSFNAKNVKIITTGGKVTLRGQVNSDAERSSVEATAIRVAGNANVDNQLVVKK